MSAAAGGTADFFYREAQRLGYVARSAFKLVQIQKQYKLITPGSSVLDLGCAPGAWLQVACQSLGPLKTGGVVVGVDLKKVKVPSTHCDSRVSTICADVMNLPKHEFLNFSPEKKGFSVVLSDMCPLVSGITTRDSALSMELGMRALDLALGGSKLPDVPLEDGQTEKQLNKEDDVGILKPGGHLIVKLLESEDTKDLIKICKPLFRKSSWLRPKATRSNSREIYLICQGLN
ncbi:putative 23S rRNA (uridine(2552)-2'-O)-methyltransferase [Helianthus annuus]|nr:putative 23S rRNA (uridine(2552)-2'-O)-methyltransferase [Helianthus annuus]KAJ0558386.1 putative 23S rRNA (uridine(2552)-2'-O)-methyltransferase [Helianthus annuus]KAJ0564324.1 putative 23S rRNA (uridine(2552)-2'-O)-methyltransferase [Helianthus annuus]KAJ0729657.1 putative 23S rRNA (uridine(2552)-2'-O)-methyltransferase [Helianthus annuus]KAJ0732396.1 putative 23S rRNA (uridine(2552)-2'-O)-methyltransferase [Helianthus annuus]